MFKGVWTALVTPFVNGKIDFESLKNVVEDQINGGINGLVVCGTTAESPTLSDSEQFEILDYVCKVVDKRVPIVFGSGSNNTAATVEKSKKACEFPIDGLLVVVPYYNKPPQEGMVAHFTAVADNCSKPVILYNVPGRTVAALAPETVIELSKHENIVAIKEANADLNNFSKYKNLVPDNFGLLSGDDESCISFCFLGGHGVISVCSHLAPSKMVSWVQRAIEKDETVREEYRQNLAWINSCYVSANPIPVKYGLFKKGLIQKDEVRLPLVTMSNQLKEKMLLGFSDFKGIL